MRSVEFHVPRRELRERMGMMRIWLDEHRFEPSVFSCQDVEGNVLVHIEFKVASEAAAFAVRFGGRPAGAGGKARGASERDILKSALPGVAIG
jgi:hypothetical protein